MSWMCWMCCFGFLVMRCDVESLQHCAKVQGSKMVITQGTIIKGSLIASFFWSIVAPIYFGMMINYIFGNL